MKIVPGSAATVNATCTTISAVHVRPSCIPAPRDENCWRPACTRLPVAFSAGSTPMRTAATTARTADVDDHLRRHARLDPVRPPVGPIGPVLQVVAEHPERDDQQRETQRGGRHRQHQRFNEQLRDDAAASGAERRSHGDLAKARGRACIDEDRDIHRDDEQQQCGAELQRAQAELHRGRLDPDERLRVGNRPPGGRCRDFAERLLPSLARWRRAPRVPARASTRRRSGRRR